MGGVLGAFGGGPGGVQGGPRNVALCQETDRDLEFFQSGNLRYEQYVKNSYKVVRSIVVQWQNRYPLNLWLWVYVERKNEKGKRAQQAQASTAQAVTAS